VPREGDFKGGKSACFQRSKWERLMRGQRIPSEEGQCHYEKIKETEKQRILTGREGRRRLHTWEGGGARQVEDEGAAKGVITLSREIGLHKAKRRGKNWAVRLWT